MREKLTKMVSVITETLVLKPAGIILIQLNGLIGNDSESWQKNLRLIPIPAKNKQ
jgi:hypothetical protein